MALVMLGGILAIGLCKYAVLDTIGSQLRTKRIDIIGLVPNESLTLFKIFSHGIGMDAVMNLCLRDIKCNGVPGTIDDGMHLGVADLRWSLQ